ncbi:phosphotransacetylase [Macrococcus hajekii]|uniref:Phosphotransacetylase n=1 Tax=Macrococcus hajekii TaxID=198482 RepID=A0A4R6BK23_9STAP|nr:phosphate acyltransferase [Macrococcus hajekii]TDM01966.1 phosphotransacetylase [Macrococcus hajekii]GGB08901.1 branched-chain phosphotransacylase [Macrococcus hajekii]
MITIAVPGGSRQEIVDVMMAAQKAYGDNVHFLVFDSTDNLAPGLWTYQYCEDEEESVAAAVKAIVNGDAQILMKGLVQTRTVLKEVLKKENDLRDKTLLSHVTLVHLPQIDRQIMLTDAAMNIEPTADQLVQIIENAVEVCHSIGIKTPKVALLSSAEKFNPKMPSSVLASEVMTRMKDYKQAVIYGPLSLDLAISEKAVRHKRFEAPIAGDADVIVVPNIDVGNALYKSFVIVGNAVNGGTIVGAKVPIVLTSRSDETESKLFALDFAIKQVQV